MQTSKLAKAIKKSKHLQVVNAVDENGELFQLVGYAGNLYRIENMPMLNDVQMLTFLGMEKEDKGSLNYQESNFKGKLYYDDYPGEKQLHWSVLASDPELTAFWPDDISDSDIAFGMTDSFGLAGLTGSTRAFMRKFGDIKYIAIKDGMFLRALLAPQKVSVERLIERIDHERRLLERLGGEKHE